MSNSRKLPYFFNTETKTSSWDAPEGLTQEEIERLPGAELLASSATAAAAAGVPGTGSIPSGQVRASHLLIKHRGSRRPSSWKEVRIGSQNLKG